MSRGVDEEGVGMVVDGVDERDRKLLEASGGVGGSVGGDGCGDAVEGFAGG